MVEVAAVLNLLIIGLLTLLSSGQETRDCLNETISYFWHESVENCQVDIKNTVDIYQRNAANHEKDDEFSELLSFQLENTLKHAMEDEIVDVISSKSVGDKKDLLIFKEDFNETHKSIARSAWKQALNKLALTMDLHLLIQQILFIPNDRLQFAVIQYLWQQFSTQFKSDPKLTQIITFSLAGLLKRGENLTTMQLIQADAILKQMPASLLLIYQSWNYKIALVNHQHNEYLFADSDKGPAPQQRFLFTYIPPKSSLNIQGKFKTHFNSQGMVALSTVFQGTDHFLKTENNRVFFCLDCDTSEPSDWWNIVWSSDESRDNQDQYVYIQHAETEDLLCATTEYDSYRRWVQSLKVMDYSLVKSCQWKPVKKTKKS